MYRVLLCLSLFVSNTNAQTLSASLSNDLRLLFTNDNHLNEAPTEDSVISLNLNYKRLNTNLNIEFADLYGGYYTRRYIGFGYDIINHKYFSVSPEINFGILYRYANKYRSNGYGLPIRIKFSNFALLFNNQYTERLELLEKYNDLNHWRYSFFVGIEFIL